MLFRYARARSFRHYRLRELHRRKMFPNWRGEASSRGREFPGPNVLLYAFPKLSSQCSIYRASIH